MNKIDKRFLIPEPIVFVEKHFHSSGVKAIFFKQLFIVFNILSMLASFAILVLSTTVFSGVIFKGTPSWYFYTTSIIASFVTLITSLINFFYIKELYQKNNKLHKYISGEIIKYSAKLGVYGEVKNPELELYHKVSLMMDIKVAKEVEDARN